MTQRKTANPLMSVINHSLIDLPTPGSISFMWNFGSLLGVCLISQILTGLFLAMYYCPSTSQAFESVTLIMRDVSNGAMIRSMHANGASMMFLCLYSHVGRGIYFKSYYNIKAWTSGVVLIFLTMAAAFLGYVLPWGQMSFWGATVITNLLSAVPYLGQQLVEWLWGGYSVSEPTLSRFFALHFVLPLILAALAGVHLALVHERGASNPLGVTGPSSALSFSPFFSVSDLITLFLAFLVLAFISLYSPYCLMDPDNFIPANPLVTPEHIQPEWYFLFAYAILRSIPSKIGGVMALLMSILIILVLPVSGSSNMRSSKFYCINRSMFWAFVVLFLMLTWAGAQPVEPPYIVTSQCLAILYFLYFAADSVMLKVWDLA